MFTKRVKIILSVMIIITLCTGIFTLTSCKKEKRIIYRILQMTDPQYAFGVDVEAKSTDSIKRLVKKTKPDLIVITGDLVHNKYYNGGIYQEVIDFLDTFKTPYAIVFGNHDCEGKNTKDEIAEIVKSGEYSVFEDGPEEISGKGNYIINIDNTEGNICWSLIMIDSNEYLEGRYDYIHQDQVEWYRESVAALKEHNGGKLNSLAFFHIPLPEYNDAWLNKDQEGVIYHFGEKRQNVNASKVNSGLFQVMKELDSTRGIFAGHDHNNDFSITYQGIRLTCGLKTAYGSFGTENVRGGNLICLTENDFIVNQIFCN